MATGYKSNFSFPVSKFYILELLGALLIAVVAGLIFRTVFFSPYLVRDNSMNPTLQVGDRVLTNKFVKLLRFGKWNPENGDLVTYSNPLHGNIPEMRRIMGGSGDTVAIHMGKIQINGEVAKRLSPPTAADSIESPFLDPRQNFEPYVVPSPGDTLDLENLGVREFQFAYNLMRQENPDLPYVLECALMLNEKEIPDTSIGEKFKLSLDSAKGFSLDSLSWIDLANLETQLSNRYPKDNISFKHTLYLEGDLVESYVVQNGGYFVVGDNWNESYDSRYWGILSREHLHSKPFIVYWSHEPNGWHKINFSRILKIVT